MKYKKASGFFEIHNDHGGAGHFIFFFEKPAGYFQMFPLIPGGYPCSMMAFSKDPLAFLHFIGCPLLRLPSGYHGKNNSQKDGG